MRVLKIILKKYPMVAMALLAAGTIFVGVNAGATVYRSLAYRPLARGGKGAAVEATRQRPPLAQYAVIFQRDLFAAPLTLEERTEPGLKAAKAGSNLPFKLKGTVVVSGGVSVAIVEDTATRKEEIYHENELVQGYRILKIARNKMVIDRNGYEEVVEVPEEAERGATTPVPITPTVQKPRLLRPPLRGPAPVPASPPPEEEAP